MSFVESCLNRYHAEVAKLMQAPFAVGIGGIVVGIGLSYVFHFTMLATIGMQTDQIRALENDKKRLEDSVVRQSKEMESVKESKRPEASMTPIRVEDQPQDYKRFKSDVMEPIDGRTYMNETVELDGKLFRDCKFINVKLMYHGTAPTGILGCEMEGSTLVETDSAALSTMITLLGAIQAMPHEFLYIGERDTRTGNMRIISREGDKLETPNKKPNSRKMNGK